MNHPSDKQLRLFNAGQLGGADLDAVARHVESCEQCASRVDGVSVGLTASETLWESLPPDQRDQADGDERQASRGSADEGQESQESQESHELQKLQESDSAGEVSPSRGSDDSTMYTTSSTGIEMGNKSLPQTEPAPSQIGPYKILQPIGRGGMGQVYMAEQTSPVRRRVALKVIKTDTPSKDVLARFEAERQALAMMQHQHIAKVLDVGITDTGRPYFAMELVKGVPITDYCDKNQLTPDERLELFIQTCRAIQHAHTKGIVHRDIKPSNVLVTLVDGKPIAKVIDFGLAKALQDSTQLTNRTLFTQYGQVVGTLAYMSPEQAEMNAMDVDTRTDVYSLGVILYELLTGSTPLTRETINREAFDRVLALIREEETRRPSQRLNESGVGVARVSELRKMEPRRLSAILRGDLDWIALKALEKSRSRRYDTPAALADDVQRYLNGQPIEARPPTVGYRLQKAVAKHKATFAATAVILLSLLAGLAGTGYMWLVARANAEAAKTAEANAVAESSAAREEKKKADAAAQLAVAAEQAEREARKIASRERELARQQEAVAVAVRKFMQDDLLRQANTFQQANTGNVINKDMTVVELVKQVAEKYGPQEIQEKFPRDPRVQAEVMGTIAEISSALGEHDTAIRFADAVIETYLANSGGEPLTPEYQKAVLDKLFYQLNSKAFYELSSTVALYINNLHQTLELTEEDFGNPPEPFDLDAEIDERIDAIVEVTIRRGDPKNFVLPVLGINPPLAKLPKIVTEIAPLRTMIPEIEQRLLSRYGSEDKRNILGLFHSAALEYIVANLRSHAEEFNMGFLLKTQGLEGTFESSIAKLEAVREKLIQEDDDRLLPMIAGMETVIAVVRQQTATPREDPKILEYYQSSLAFLQGYLENEDHPALNLAKGHVAQTLESLGRYAEACELLRDVAARRARSLGADDALTLGTLDDLADTLDSLARVNEKDRESFRAISMERADCYRRLLSGVATRSEKEPELMTDEWVSKTQDRAGTSFYDAGSFDEAIKTLRSSWEYRRDNLRSSKAAEYMTTLALLARALERAGQLDEAIELQLELCQLRSEKLRSRSKAMLAFSSVRAAELLEAAGRHEEASEWLDKAGFETLENARVPLERDEQHQGLFQWERKKCGWGAADFEADEASGWYVVSYAPGLWHQRHVRFNDTQPDYKEAARQLTADGWTQMKLAKRQVDGQTQITTLWRRTAE